MTLIHHPGPARRGGPTVHWNTPFKVSTLYRYWLKAIGPQQRMMPSRYGDPVFAEDLYPSLWFELDDVDDDPMPLQPYLDFGRLAKLMNQTTSDQDGEALMALRMANEIVRQAGTTWAEILLRVIREQLKEEKPPAQDLTAEQVLEQTLRFLLETKKITQPVHDRLLRMVRWMFRSRDTGLARRTYRRIRDILSGSAS